MYFNKGHFCGQQHVLPKTCRQKKPEYEMSEKKKSRKIKWPDWTSTVSWPE